MENKLTSFCTGQEEALQKLIKDLVEKYQPEQIICFGRIQHSNHSSSCFFEPAESTSYHYFLLMITAESKRIEFNVQDFVNFRFADGKVTILSHGKKTVEEAILKGSRFFTTVLSQGCILYSKDGFIQTYAISEVDIVQTLEKARRQFERRFPLAKGFLNAAQETLATGHYSVAVFILHQVLEQSLATLIQVYIAYRTDMHHLGRMLDLCGCFLSQTDTLFPRNTKEEQRLFTLLNNSYSGARYKDNFTVSAGDVTLICEKVKECILAIENLCMHQLVVFEAAVKARVGRNILATDPVETEVHHG
ncbi:HEPN domain-containing protein [Solitalea lacus]|uniref:HEPN domain-containing protein n=1 Tax=Solitalea lacus TaxID=2911172 RepID=UPI001EDBEC43|nr:HEPN domain-containing protein [Solitalea lacus]UKJ09182.1 HEPN domain-containing protein [Solitalea lacus]